MKQARPCVRAAILLAAVLLTACAGIRDWGLGKPGEAGRTAEAVKARELAAALGDRNRALSSFKGIGRFRLQQGNRRFSSRAAWIGAYPDKLRIALLNAAGQPMASLSADGKSLYMLSHSDGKFYERSAAHPTLERLVSIPISITDIVSVLAGRFPIRKYDRAELGVDPEKDQYQLTLSRKWRGTSEIIYLDPDNQKVLEDEVFEGSGDLAYRTVLHGEQMVDNFRIPLKIIVSDDQGNLFELDIENCWVNVPHPPTIFVLTPP